MDLRLKRTNIVNELKIAVIGGGIAGITAAHYLGKSHAVTLIESSEYLGGHTNTRSVTDSQTGDELSIDTGFIVCNERNYPHFYAFLRELDVPLRDSNMSFGFSCQKTGLEYLGPGLQEFLSAPKCIFRKDFLQMAWDQRRFNQSILNDLRNDSLHNEPLGNYLRRLNVSKSFIQNYIIPIIGSIWSGPDVDVLHFPTKTLATFFDNHGMLELSTRPQWQTVVGGSQQYVKKFLQIFKGEVRLSSPVKSITRTNGQVTLRAENKTEEIFDKVIVATHADQALRLLAAPTTDERDALKGWHYNRSSVVLHTDEKVMPKNKSVWGAWNYVRNRNDNSDELISITYYMNRLQGLKSKQNYFVTLNRDSEIHSENKIYQTVYEHPVYTPANVDSQLKIKSLNSTSNVLFCGSYCGYGFHEDGVTSALDACDALEYSLSGNSGAAV